MDGSVLLQIARDAITSKFTGKSLNQNQYIVQDNKLDLNGATFITLTEKGQLRGCIGTLVAHRKLYDDIVSNAQSAAFNDPRFSPLTMDELEDITVEVSLLTQPQKIAYSDKNDLIQKIRPGIDGVILVLGHKQATFLPQVWEDLPDFNLFFSHLGLKAGIGHEPLSLHPDIYIYQVEKYKENK